MKWSRKTAKHGVQKHPAYGVWADMKQRCYNPNNPRYKDYGGRGIRVCREWHMVKGFLQWVDSVGRPDGYQLDREDNNGDYEPDNCRFVTPKQNTRNTRSNIRLTFEGQTMCVPEWAELLGINAGTIRSRLKRGWAVRDVLRVSINNRRKI